jgi:hypothetical protein
MQARVIADNLGGDYAILYLTLQRGAVQQV